MSKYVQHLAEKGAEIATEAAILWFRKRGRTPPPASSIVPILDKYVKARWDETMADMFKAFASGMSGIAEASFAASMMVAGCEAAKEYAKESVN